eukprot:SAG31_NODE_3267_length_4478_cov_2.996118_5_plen_182_part_00
MLTFGHTIVKNNKELFGPRNLATLTANCNALKEFQYAMAPIFNGDDRTMAVTLFFLNDADHTQARHTFGSTPPVLKKRFLGLYGRADSDIILKPRKETAEETMVDATPGGEWSLFVHGARLHGPSLNLNNDTQLSGTVPTATLGALAQLRYLDLGVTHVDAAQCESFCDAHASTVSSCYCP